MGKGKQRTSNRTIKDGGVQLHVYNDGKRPIGLKYFDPIAGRVREKSSGKFDREEAIVEAEKLMLSIPVLAGPGQAFDRKPSRRSRAKSTRKGVIYALEAMGLGLVKIGWSENVITRLPGLMSIVPVECRPLAFRLGIIKDEHKMQDMIADYHAKNEWYYLAPLVREAISKHMQTVPNGMTWHEFANPMVLEASAENDKRKKNHNS